MSKVDFDKTGLDEEIANVLSRSEDVEFEDSEDYEILVNYDVSEHARIRIIEHKPTSSNFYWVDVPELSDDHRRATYRTVDDVEEYIRQIETDDMNDEEIRETIRSKGENFIHTHLARDYGGYLKYLISRNKDTSIADRTDIKDYNFRENISKVSEQSVSNMLYFVERELLDFGKLTPIIEDESVEDISCNGPGLPVHVYHNRFGNLPTNIFYNDEELEQFVIELSQRADKHISIANPNVSGRTRDGYRVQLTLSDEVSPKGSNFTIRKYKTDPFTPIDLLDFETFSLDQLVYLWLAIENRKSLIFAGGTASGKTTSMNAVSMFIPPGSKVVSIEDTQEISLQHSNWVQNTTRDTFGSLGEMGEVSMYQLLRDALRQRPEYIIVGEIRGKEARTLFQAMNTGHTTYSTMHAESARSAMDRLKNEPINVSKQLINALDIISVQTRRKVDGNIVRRCEEISELENTSGDNPRIKSRPIFQYSNTTDSMEKVAQSRQLQKIQEQNNWSEEDLEDEIERRKKLLKLMQDRDEDYDYLDVTSVLRQYHQNPEVAISRVKEGDVK